MPDLPLFIEPSTVSKATLDPLVNTLNGLQDQLYGSRTRTVPVGCTVRRTSAQNISSSTDTLISFSTSEFDNDNMWSLASPTIMTIRTAGLYIASAYIRYAFNSTGKRVAAILRNGTSPASNTISAGGGMDSEAGQTHAMRLFLNVNDTLRLNTFQNSGVALNTDTAFGGVYMTAVRIAGG